MTITLLPRSDRSSAPGTSSPSLFPARANQNAGTAADSDIRNNAGAGVLADLPAPVTFTMPTPPSVNEIYKNIRGKGRAKSGVYDNFILMAIAAIRRQRVPSVNGRLIALFGVERMSLQADIDNRLKAMLDAIVKADVIEDDSLITGIAISWLPKANGMAHVMLLPVQPLDLTFQPSPNGATGGWFLQAPFQNDGDFNEYV